MGRFAATHAAVLVQPRDDRAHAVAVDAAGVDNEHLRRWLVRSGKLYRGPVTFESAAITGDITTLEHAALSDDTAAPTIGTIMHLPLHDEHGETIGIVAAISDRREAFGESQLEEFRELVRILSGLVRRSLLLEQVVREQALLAHEGALMTE
ncbi:MAG TPA: hypothetical protein VMU65_06105, partial [Candidatus Saccharimonadales bacterium]|nr:hypothetical protein [Candidatus Saccharimonadales bacterium]